ncbi:MAG: hypothetical protein ACREB9_01080 [Thermoplasmata archaeon]
MVEARIQPRRLRVSANARGAPTRRSRRTVRLALTVLGTIVAIAVLWFASIGPAGASSPPTAVHAIRATPSASTPSPVTNFSSSINRLVELVAVAGGGILALVWARVAFSWFSNDISKKVQAKDRARDALIGTLVFTAAITGLVWGLAQWVLTGA